MPYTDDWVGAAWACLLPYLEPIAAPVAAASSGASVFTSVVVLSPDDPFKLRNAHSYALAAGCLVASFITYARAYVLGYKKLRILAGLALVLALVVPLARLTSLLVSLISSSIPSWAIHYSMQFVGFFGVLVRVNSSGLGPDGPRTTREMHEEHIELCRSASENLKRHCESLKGLSSEVGGAAAACTECACITVTCGCWRRVVPPRENRTMTDYRMFLPIDEPLRAEPLMACKPSLSSSPQLDPFPAPPYSLTPPKELLIGDNSAEHRSA